MRIPLILTAAGASFAIVLFSACSSSETTSSNQPQAASVAGTASQSVLLSLQQSTNAKTASMEFNATINGIPAIGSQKVTGTGAVDFAGQKASAHLEVLGLSVDGIVDGATTYARSALLGADTWYRSDATKAQGFAGAASAWANLVDPSQLFATIKDSSDSMTEVGHEQVRGADTIHYTGVIDLKKRAQAAGAAPEALDALGSSGVTTVPVDVWVDGQGLVTRIQTALSVSGSQTGTADGISGDVTAEFFDYGKAVSISAPPAAHVKDASEALSGLGNVLPKKTP